MLVIYVLRVFKLFHVEHHRRVPLLVEQASAVVLLESLPKMSTENSTTGQDIESLRAALSAAKYASLQAESRLNAAKKAVVSAEVDLKVQAGVIAYLASKIASLSVEETGKPDEYGYPAFDVFTDGVAFGYVKFFGYDCSYPWSAFLYDGDKCENCLTRAAAELWVSSQFLKKVA